MMNQGSNTETVTNYDPNLIENRRVDAAQGQTSSYFPSIAGSEAVPWNMQRGENYSMDNRTPSNIAYNHGQYSEPPSKDGQDALNATSHASSSSLGTHSSAQQYNSYASYSNTTDSYGYANTGYYNGYQQQPSNAYPQPAGAYQNTGAPYQSLSSFQNSGSYAGSASYSTTYYNPGDYQTAGGYPSGSYNSQTTSWNEGNYSNYAHQYTNYTPDSTGTYSSNTAPATSQQYQQDYKQWADYYSQAEVPCAPGTENLSVTSTSSTTHLVPVSGGYPVSNSHTNLPSTPSWRPESSFSSSTIAQPPTPSSGVSDGYWKYGAPTLQNHVAASAQPQYQKPYDPTTSYNSYQEQQKAATPQIQLQYQKPFDPATSYNSYQEQQKAATPQIYSSYQDQQKTAAPQVYNSFQDQQRTAVPQVYNSFQDQQRTAVPQVYNSFQDQQRTAVPQGPTFQYTTSHQAPLNFQPSGQTAPSSDTRRVNTLQIPTNPRIALNFPLGLTKTDKDSSIVGGASKPAYIGVSLPKPNHKVSSVNASDFKTGTFPSSLRGYVERALARCKDDTQKAACQGFMKEMITNATADGTLFTRDWDMEPLFPIPDASVISDDNQQCSTPGSSLHKFSGRRTKSRWEPLPEEKSIDKTAAVVTGTPRYTSWSDVNERDRKLFGGNSEDKENGVSSAKFSWSEQRSTSKSSQRSSKRQRMAGGSSTNDNGELSSDSDKEQNLAAYHSGVKTFLDTPEERKRRESRSKRFDKGQGTRSENMHHKEKQFGAANLYSRKDTALMLSKNSEDGANQAVEDIDWDSLTVKGTCQEIEKRYLRLTSAPDPATVRPEEVLEKALLMVQNSQKNYLYKCDQLKSIRQDLTVQRIRNELTVRVYETHARLALEAGDFPEYNQCQSQIKTLYSEGIEGCHMEFSAYSLLYVTLHSNNKRDLLSLMSRMSDETKKDESVKHALAVRTAVTSGNYVTYFRLYKTAPNLNTCLMDFYVEKMRYKAVSCMSRAYRPTVPVSYIAQVLSFTAATPTDEINEGISFGTEECVEWLKAHGACLITDGNGELQLDTKVSSSSLYMPEPEDAVPHGDANLAVNDFFTRMRS